MELIGFPYILLPAARHERFPGLRAAGRISSLKCNRQVDVTCVLQLCTLECRADTGMIGCIGSNPTRKEYIEKQAFAWHAAQPQHI